MNIDDEVYTAGSSFDDFLEEEGILYEAEASAMKKVIAFQLAGSQAPAWEPDLGSSCFLSF